MSHPTVEPDNVPMGTKVRRLVRDLESLICVSSVSTHTVANNGVVFESEGSIPGDIPSDVLRVLAEHNAFILRYRANTPSSTSEASRAGIRPVSSVGLGYGGKRRTKHKVLGGSVLTILRSQT